MALRFDPELDAFLVGETLRPIQTQAGFTVLPNYGFTDKPAIDAFLIPGGFGTRQEMHNRNLYAFIQSLPESCLLTSVCTGSWIYGKMGLLDGLATTLEMGFHVLRRAGYDETFLSEVARTMEYHQAYEIYRPDLELS